MLKCLLKITRYYLLLITNLITNPYYRKSRLESFHRSTQFHFAVYCFDLPLFSKYPATSINSYFYKMTLLMWNDSNSKHKYNRLQKICKIFLFNHAINFYMNCSYHVTLKTVDNRQC